jgi:chromosome segregation ATPase
MVTEKIPETADGEEEVESLKKKVTELYREIDQRDAAVVKLETELKARDERIDELQAAVAEAERTAAELKGELAGAVAAYREQIIQGNPGVLADLISGENIEEIDESLKEAMALIEKVKQEMEEEAARTRVPGGAPTRTAIDLTALSPREKIRYAIGGS